jgi:hypothetical protein
MFGLEWLCAVGGVSNGIILWIWLDTRILDYRIRRMQESVEYNQQILSTRIDDMDRQVRLNYTSGIRF